MAEHGPIGARNVAPLDGFVPQPEQRGLVLGLGELLDGGLVTVVERLLDELAAALRPPGERNTLLVQVVIGRGFCAGNAKLDEQAADLPAGQAGADDRTMHAVMHVPDRGAPLGRRLGKNLADVVTRGARFHGNHAAGKHRVFGREPAEKMLANRSGARDDMVARYISANIATCRI